MIPEDLAPLIEPLEQFEAIRRSVVRLGDRLCDLSYANPYMGVQEGARAALRAALDDERLLDLQYTPFGGHTLARRATADALRASHGLAFGYRHVVLTPGAMAALHVSLHACGNPGDEVVIPTPCWLDYPLYTRVTGRVPVIVPLAGERFDLDLEAIAAALSQRTCALLLSTPANPTGRCYDAATVASLAAIVREAEQRHGRPITVIADETHRDFVEPQQFHSLAKEFHRTVLVYSFGKYHFLQGQRLGYVAVSPHHPQHEEVSSEMTRWTRALGLATPTALMQRALPALLNLRHDLSWLDGTRRHMADALADQGYRVTPADGTLFMYVRTPADQDDMDFTRQLARKGVLVLPAPVFHHRGYVRLALTASGTMLDRALEVFTQCRGPRSVAAAVGAASASVESGSGS